MKLFIAMMAIAVPFLFTACTETAIEIQASELCCKYWAYESEADAEFKGKILIVAGEVGLLDVNNLGEHYARLECHCDFLTIQELRGDGISCMFDESNVDDWLALREGQYVQIKGNCNGCAMNLFGKGEPGNIILLDCQVIR